MAEKTNIPMTAIDSGRQTIWHLQKMKDEERMITMVGTAYLDPLFTMMCEKARSIWYATLRRGKTVKCALKTSSGGHACGAKWRHCLNAV